MANLNLYKIFSVVAKEKNISKASEILYISQPAVSFSIKELEKELDQKLFIRKSKGVELTTFGEMLYNKINNAILIFDEAEILATKFNKLEQGIIRIGANTSNVNQILINYLNIFAKKYPNIQISTTKGSREQLISQLQNNELDIIFVDNFEESNNFKIIKNYNIKYQLIGDKNYKLKYPQNNISPKDFPTGDLIVPSTNNDSKITINRFFEKENIIINPKYEFDNYILLYEFVKNGFGIAFVNTDYYKNELENHEIEKIFPEFSIFARDIVCLTNKNTSNIALDKFVEIINNN